MGKMSPVPGCESAKLQKVTLAPSCHLPHTYRSHLQDTTCPRSLRGCHTFFAGPLHSKPKAGGLPGAMASTALPVLQLKGIYYPFFHYLHDLSPSCHTCNTDFSEAMNYLIDLHSFIMPLHTHSPETPSGCVPSKDRRVTNFLIL